MNTSKLAWRLAAVVVSVWFSLGTGPLPAASYKIQDLGTLGGNSSGAFAVNDQGQVVGWADTAEVDSNGLAIRHAFLWLPRPAAGMAAGMHDLGTFGGERSFAWGLNEKLQVVGWAEDGTVDDSGLPTHRPFLWQLGSLLDLGTAHPAFSGGEARSINELGQVVGRELDVFACRPFLWLPEPAYGLPADIQPLPLLPGHVEGDANDINDSGEVAMRSTVGCDTTAGSATLWLPAAAHGLPAGVHDLTPNSQPADRGDAVAINSRGEVAGVVEGSDFEPQLFVWREGVRTELPQPPGPFFSFVTDINDRGDVLGSAGGPFLWSDGERIALQDLLPEDSPWELVSANGINGRGEIVGRGRLDGAHRAYLLSPLVFADGFESGDTSAWSAEVP